VAALVFAGFRGGVALAQVPGTGSPASINTAFVKLFGPIKAFSAKVDTQVLNSWQIETARMPMDLALLDGKIRIEINLAQVKSKDIAPDTIDRLKQSGMDHLISIFRPDKKVTYVMYPGVQSYQTIPLPPSEAAAAEKGFTVEKTPVGQETIDGQACVKNKVLVKGEKGPVLEAVTWNAPGLKDFPVQIELREKLNTVRMHFTQIRFASLDPSQFEVPAKYGRMK